MQTLLSSYKQIPAYIRGFLLKALMILVIWKMLYLLALQPAGIPDYQLKQVISSAAAKMLSVFYIDVTTVDEGYTFAIQVGGKRILGIAPACTGLELMALYIGVLLCLPGKINRQILFILLGIVAIMFINAFRCAVLVWIHMEHYSLFDLAHKWIFKLAVYFAVFYGWTLYLKGYGRRVE